MRNPDCSKRRICATHVFGLTATLALLLACAVRVDAAVELADFDVTAQNGYILIEWETGTEINNAGFRLYHEYPELDRNRMIVYELLPSPCMGQVTGCEYSHEDHEVQDGITYHYWLESLNLAGGGSEFYYLGSATPGAPATATPTSTPTETATSTPTATPTFTPTNLPTATPTSTPTAVPSAAPTSTPTSLPGGTPTSTPATRPTATPTSVATFTPSPSMTTAGTGEPPTTSVPTTADVWPSPTPTSQVVGALTDQTESPERSVRLQATSWRPPGVTWPTVSTSIILLFMSVISLLGVLLLATALVLARKFGL